jgi:purine-binding chemotaxis protein CheW
MALLIKSSEIFCFTIEKHLFAIPVKTVGQVLMAMAVTPVPNSPEIIYGVIDYHGVIIPVINLRFRLKLPAQPIRVNDVFIIVETSKRTIALVADEGNEVIAADSNDMASTIELETGFGSAGFFRRDDGIIVIYDVEKFLTDQEEIELQTAIEKLTNESI